MNIFITFKSYENVYDGYFIMTKVSILLHLHWFVEALFDTKLLMSILGMFGKFLNLSACS